jgi:hypothetical protein
MAVVDEVSPAACGQDLIRLSLSPQTRIVRAFAPCVLTVDYALTMPAGVVLPLVLTVTQSAGVATYQRRVYRRLRPSVIAFSPREGGPCLVRLGEGHHNRWFGSLALEVEGGRIEQ